MKANTEAAIRDMSSQLRELGKAAENIRDEAASIRAKHSAFPGLAEREVSLLLPRAVALESSHGAAFQLVTQTLFNLPEARFMAENNIEKILALTSWWIILYDTISERCVWLRGCLEESLND